MAAPAFTGQQGYGSYGGTTTTAVSSSLTTVTGQGVLVIAAWQDTATAPTLTDSKSNSAPTLIGTVLSGPAFGVTAYLGVYLHTAIGTGGTSHTFTATGPANSYPAIAALSLDQAVALDTTTGVNDTSSPWVAATLTTGAVDCLVLACGGIPDAAAGNTVSATGYTQQMSQGNGPDWGISVLRKTVAASGSSETPSITSSPGGANSDSGQVRMVSLKAAGATNYPLPVTAATYSVTASAETLAAGRALPVTAASYAVTAAAITLAVGRKVDVASTSYALTAAAEALTVDRKLDIAAASYALTAANITLTYTPSAVGLAVDPAAYVLTAAAVSFGVERKLAYASTSYALSAAAETLAVGRALNFVATSYAVTTSAETLVATRALSVDPVAYSLTAAPVTLTYESANKQLDIEPASYSVAMADVGLLRSSGGGFDSWGSVYVRKKKKPEVGVAGPLPGPTLRQTIEKAVAATEPKPPSFDYEQDEDEALMLLT